jgi:hypothetical protein
MSAVNLSFSIGKIFSSFKSSKNSEQQMQTDYIPKQIPANYIPQNIDKFEKGTTPQIVDTQVQMQQIATLQTQQNNPQNHPQNNKPEEIQLKQ